MHKDSPVTVRIAPSPTGDPHVGTAYIALFNRALRVQRGGRFILRIEDTDRKRSTLESERMIFDALSWLGLEHDEGPDKGGPAGPYRQSERTAEYVRHSDMLLARGLAYRCFCTEERIAALREDQKAKKLDLGYDGFCRELQQDDAASRMREGMPFVVRMKVPKEGETIVDDVLRGRITFQNKGIDDQVLLKSDGFPTYHLANVVDDHLMGVTHVMRAEEWISSTPKHVLLYDAFGWEKPVFLHMPLLRNKDTSKISKRKNPVSLIWYRDCGYLPEAMVNFIGLMGYSVPPEQAPSPDNPEIFTFEQLVKLLDLNRIKTSGPVFDLQKLDSFNGFYVRAMKPSGLAGRILDFLAYLGAGRDRLARQASQQVELKGDAAEREERRRAWTAPALAMAAAPPSRADVEKCLPLVQERLHGLLDFADRTAYLFAGGGLDYDASLLVDKKQKAAEVKAALEGFAAAAAGVADWKIAGLEECARVFCEKAGIKPKSLYMSLRVAVTGRTVSPPLFESMEFIGRDRSLARIADAAGKLQ